MHQYPLVNQILAEIAWPYVMVHRLVPINSCDKTKTSLRWQFLRAFQIIIVCNHPTSSSRAALIPPRRLNYSRNCMAVRHHSDTAASIRNIKWPPSGDQRLTTTPTNSESILISDLWGGDKITSSAAASIRDTNCTPSTKLREHTVKRSLEKGN